MSKRLRECGEDCIITDHTTTIKDVNTGIILDLDNIEHYVKELIINTLEFYSPVLILVSRSWNRFFRDADKGSETWDQRMKRWYLSHLKPTELAYINYHERDKHINMNEELHKYTITHWLPEKGAFSIIYSRPKSDPDRQKGLLSTTSFIDTTFDEFDADHVIKKMMASHRWRFSKYYGKTAEEIKEEWEENRVKAASDGTANHLNLENYHNEKPYDPTTKEFALFTAYDEERIKADLIPWRTEQMIYDTRLMICGSVDMQYTPRDPAKQFDAQGRRVIVLADWKFSKEIKYENRWQKGNCPLTAQTEDCNYEHYCMQLRIYKMQLERNYNVVIPSMYLVILHANQDKPIKIDVPIDPRKEAKIIRYRRSILCTAS